jgi:hypothetical protein
MKSLLTAVLGVMCITLFSCQKEVKDIFSNNGSTGTTGGGTDGLLVKAISVTGSDSQTTVYTYDNMKRLETLTIDGTTGGIQAHTYKKYIRDASSRISRILQVIIQNGLASDTTVELVHYPGSGMEFDYTVNTISMSGFAVIDSSAYTYSSGNMTSMMQNLSSPLLGSGTLAQTKMDFTYDASGNLTILKTYADLGTGTLSPAMNQTYTYGTTINANWLTTNGAQNFLLVGNPGFGNKAFVKAQMDNLVDPSTSFTMTATYNMGSNNKPKSAMMTSTNGQVIRYTFFYQ